MRSIFILGLVALTSVGAAPATGTIYAVSTVKPVAATALLSPAGRARLAAYQGIVRLPSGQLVPAGFMRRILAKPPAEPVKRYSLRGYNHHIAVVGPRATALYASGAASFQPNSSMLAHMHVTGTTPAETAGLYVTPAVFAKSAPMTTVKLPPQQTGGCAVTLCANFSNGTETALDVLANDFGSAFSGYVKNPDGSFEKAADGNCLARPMGSLKTQEVACPATPVNVNLPPCTVLCAPQHFHISIMDTWIFDHYETDGTSQCGQGFTVTPELGSDDGVAHTLYIHVTYAQAPPAAAAFTYQTSCNINVFIKGPQGSDWGA